MSADLDIDDMCFGHREALKQLAELRAIETAARKLFTAKGWHHSQIAMCELGELLGYPVVWPVKKGKAE